VHLLSFWLIVMNHKDLSISDAPGRIREEGSEGGRPVFPLTALSASSEQRLTASEARQHMGEHATVCGVVASASYAERARGQPTFLNLDKPYPNQIFTIVIWGENRAKFGAPESKYLDKRICVSGLIRNYHGEPETMPSDPSQIQEQPQ
jgi:hypothetical protein